MASENDEANVGAEVSLTCAYCGEPEEYDLVGEHGWCDACFMKWVIG